jgi:hypothetical protein
MPFGKTTDDHTEEYWTKHFTDYLKPLIEENSKVEARRSKPLRGDVVREIVKALIVSRIVLADLTDSKANVYWELGVRQSFKPCTITIADEGYRGKIPFDLASKGILFYYPDDVHKDASFRADLKNAIQDCLKHPNRPDSPVLDTVSGRGTLYEIVHREESIRRLDALIQELRQNERVYAKVVETARRNRLRRKKGKPAIIPFIRFRPVSTELLLAYRYLDEPAEFYRWVGSYHNLSSQTNDQLNSWAAGPARTEKWLLGKIIQKSSQEILKGIRERVEAARHRLVSQVPG